MDGTVQFECEEVEDAFHCIKVEPDEVHRQPEVIQVNPTGSCSDIFPTSTNAVTHSSELQTDTIDSAIGFQHPVVCECDSAEEAEMESSHMWSLRMSSSQTASNDDIVGEVQPDLLEDASHKPQKSRRLWPIINRHSGKKWPRHYGLRKVRQHKCTECGKMFIRKQSLHRHIAIVHGPKVYFWCRRCYHFYNRRDNLRTHYRTQHPMHINDMKHIQGVRMESMLGEQLQLLNNAQAITSCSSSSSSRNPGSNGDGESDSQSRSLCEAMQLMVQERGGALSARREHTRIRDVFMNRNADNTEDNGICETSTPTRQSDMSTSYMSDKPAASTVLAPPLNNSQPPIKRSIASSSSTTAPSRGNPITVPEVVAYQLQKAASQAAEAEIVEISDDSSSDEEPEHPSCSSLDLANKETVRLELGTPFKDLHVETVMQGQVSRVSEKHHTFIYSRGEKIRTETRKRTYNVLHLDGVGEEVHQTTQTANKATISNSATDDQLRKNIQGRVTKVTETSSKYTYSDGEKITKEKTSRVYNVMLLGGLTDT